MKKKFWIILCMTMLTASLLAGCKKKEEPKKENTEAIVEEETETEDNSKEGMERSNLTGEWIDGTLAAKKPIAVMIGNTNDALPQYGLSQADILFEIPAEGGITRLMPIFQDYSGLDKIGSVRSCRHYYAYYAMEFDAVYVHYGQAIYATELLDSGKVEDLNGIQGAIDATTFYRDKSRKAPHNAFVSTEGIDAGIEHQKFDTELPADYKAPYTFNEEDEKQIELTGGEDAAVVQPGYYINNPWFVYNEKDGQYYRFQYKKEHMDENTETQLSFKNVMIQYNEYSKLDDPHGYLDVKTAGEGTGKYITNGKSIDITWKKDREEGQTHYFDASGKEITLNQGKTMVCVMLNDMKDRLDIFADESDFTPPSAK